jgi:hypothetical protein
MAGTVWLGFGAASVGSGAPNRSGVSVVIALLGLIL